MVRATFNKLRIYEELPIQQLLLDGPASQKFENQQILLAIHQTWKERSYGKIARKETEDFRALNPPLDFKPFYKVQKDTHMGEYWEGSPIFSLCVRSQFEPMKPNFFDLEGPWARYSRFPFYGEIRHQPIVL
jgi:hypothetical protein